MSEVYKLLHERIAAKKLQVVDQQNKFISSAASASLQWSKNPP